MKNQCKFENLYSYPVNQVIGIVLGGGVGTRLYPLTKERSKPAVPFAGNYRLIDIPISNCIHSGINRVFILTQFMSASLNRHINQTYKFDIFHNGFVEVLASEETYDNMNKGFPHGTADAVRKSMRHIDQYRDVKYGLVLAGDQLYKLNFRRLLAQQIENDAEVTLGLMPVRKSEAFRFGMVHMNEEHQIIGFSEKPKDISEIADWTMPDDLYDASYGDRRYLASMNIYLFSFDLLKSILVSHQDMMDFGKDVIPHLISRKKVFGYIHGGFWEDVGTIKSFHSSNIALTQEHPLFNLYDEKQLFFSKPRFLPPSRLGNSYVEKSILSDGIIVEKANITNSVIGIRAIILSGSMIDNSVIMGNDFYETPEEKQFNQEQGLPDVGIGKNCEIHNAIIDKNCRIGNNVHINNHMGVDNEEQELYSIRDGIVVIPRLTTLPDNTVI